MELLIGTRNQLPSKKKTDFIAHIFCFIFSKKRNYKHILSTLGLLGFERMRPGSHKKIKFLKFIQLFETASFNYSLYQFSGKM